jgi:hypothetical protein
MIVIRGYNADDERGEDYAALFRRGYWFYNNQVDRPLVPVADACTYTALSQMSGDALRKFAEDFGLAVVYPTTPSISGSELERLDAMIDEASK